MTGGQLSQATASRRSSCLRLQHGPKRSARRRERESSKGGSCRAGCWWNGGWERNSRCVGGWERWWMREGESTGRRSRPAAPSNATKAPSSHHPAVVMVRGSRSPPAAIPPKPRPKPSPKPKCAPRPNARPHRMTKASCAPKKARSEMVDRVSFRIMWPAKLFWNRWSLRAGRMGQCCPDERKENRVADEMHN